MSERAPVERLARCPKHLFQRTEAPCDPDVWGRIQDEYRPFNVFVNIPYVPEYQVLQSTIVATLLTVGLVPRLASLRSEGQPIRLCKICELMQTSKYSITDLSRPELHNMPFELGYFLALGRVGHAMIMLDEKYVEREGVKVRKFDSQLSNLKSVEVIVHETSPQKLAEELLRRMSREVPEAQMPGKRATLVDQIVKMAKTVQDAIVAGRLDEFVEEQRMLINMGRLSPPTT